MDQPNLLQIISKERIFKFKYFLIVWPQVFFWYFSTSNIYATSYFALFSFLRLQ